MENIGVTLEYESTEDSGGGSRDFKDPPFEFSTGWFTSF